MTTTMQRGTIGAALDLMVAHRTKVGYIEERPMPTRHITSLVELRTALEGPGIEDDCSGTATLACRIAGLHDPSGNPSDSGYGNTQEMYDHLPHYLNPLEAMTGALVFLGTPGLLSTQHVCVVRHPGADPIVFTHGGPGAFAAHYTPLNTEARYHVGHPVFLSIAKL